MTIGELIKDKDYDYVEYRITLPEKVGGGDTFFGSFKVKKGKIIPNDGDCYNPDEEVVSYEEWSSGKIKKGLTIVVKRDFVLRGNVLLV